MPQPPDPPTSLQDQTITLGRMLKGIADTDPSGTPTEAAAAAFTSWMAEAGPGSRQPDYFADVQENYNILGNSNRDLFDLFDILENYIEVEDDTGDDPPPKTFIGLPLMGS